MNLTNIEKTLCLNINHAESFIFNTKYELIIKLILSSSTNEFRACEIGNELIKDYCSIDDLNRADLKDLEFKIKKIGFYRQKALRLKKAAELIIQKFNGVIPSKYDDLILIPGIGQKSAKKFLSLVEDSNYVMVDTHLRRVIKRLFNSFENLKDNEIEKFVIDNIENKNLTNFSNLVTSFGKDFCTSLKPKCSICFFKNFCNFDK